ncbi:MAG: DUF2283 domain-containing protein [Phycisphaerales bacterium]|nr:MAG: DUF2283 domain-containing protein [Phycisphaerales bacterium]
MVTPAAQVSFECSISARDDGTLEAVYLQVAQGQAERTVEVIQDILMADYDAAGNLLGFELLAPVKLADILEVVDPPIRQPFQRFVEKAAPRELVTPG